jgi:hypothetical protein
MASFTVSSSWQRGQAAGHAEGIRVRCRRRWWRCRQRSRQWRPGLAAGDERRASSPFRRRKREPASSARYTYSQRYCCDLCAGNDRCGPFLCSRMRSMVSEARVAFDGRIGSFSRLDHVDVFSHFSVVQAARPSRDGRRCRRCPEFVPCKKFCAASRGLSWRCKCTAMTFSGVLRRLRKWTALSGAIVASWRSRPPFRKP